MVAVDVDGVELEVVGVDAVGVLDAGVDAALEPEPADELLPELCVLVPDVALWCLGFPPDEEDELLEPPVDSSTAINAPIASAASRSSTGSIPVDRRGGRLGGGAGLRA